MYVAKWNNQIIAQSDNTVEIEGNQYFPIDSVNMDLLKASDLKSTCAWKGEASYFDIVVGENTNKDAVWTYQHPKDAAKEIAGHVAFWRGVEVAKV
jgi:uncharacterized protein (DUF427 family)